MRAGRHVLLAAIAARLQACGGRAERSPGGKGDATARADVRPGCGVPP